jgi:hypothetical protein
MLVLHVITGGDKGAEKFKTPLSYLIALGNDAALLQTD